MSKNFLNNQNYIKDSKSYLYYQNISDYKGVWFFYILIMLIIIPVISIGITFLLLEILQLNEGNLIYVIILIILILIVILLISILVFEEIKNKLYYSKSKIIIYSLPYNILKNKYIYNGNIKKFFEIIYK